MIVLLLALLLPLGLVAQSSVQVRSLRLDDTDLPSQAARDVVGELSGKLYNERSEVGARLLDALQKRGYFKATVLDPTFKVVGQDGGAEVVDVAAVVEAGQQYRLAGISFRNARAFTESELRRQFPVADGEIFSVEGVRQGLRRLRELYCSKGYLNFTPVPQTESNDAAASVQLTVDADEGPVYHVGQLTIDGKESEPGARERLLSAWKAHEGKVFDCNGQLFRQFLRDIHARPGVKPEDVLSSSIDQAMHVVNVRMTLRTPPKP